MSAFKALRDISNNFEEDLRKVSGELFAAKIGENFEDSIAKKLKDLTLYTSKLRLLQAKTIAGTQESQQVPDEQTVLTNYSDSVKLKVLEQQIVKTITQSHAVKTLITAKDSSLSPEMLEKKEKLIDQLTKFKEKEIQLVHLETVLKERQERLQEARREWDNQLSLLKELREDASDIEEDYNNPLANKMQQVEGKLKLLRALLSRLATARCDGYDWLADPRRRLRTLMLARQ